MLFYYRTKHAVSPATWRCFGPSWKLVKYSAWAPPHGSTRQRRPDDVLTASGWCLTIWMRMIVDDGYRRYSTYNIIVTWDGMAKRFIALGALHRKSLWNETLWAIELFVDELRDTEAAVLHKKCDNENGYGYSGKHVNIYWDQVSSANEGLFESK